MDFIIILLLVGEVYQITSAKNVSFDSSEEYEVSEIDEWINDFLSDDNYTQTKLCYETQEYKETKLEPYSHTFQVSYTKFCFNLRLSCTKFRNETKTLFKTITVLKTRNVIKCCQGYEKVNGVCVAICSEECVHGRCRKPNFCDCDTGWIGSNCTEECPSGWYGKNCVLPCNCQNGATCDAFNGTCHCPPKYIGTYCDSVCDGKIIGNECINVCLCMNAGVCRDSDALCDCPAGYNGLHCENKCKTGTFGKNCSFSCNCESGKTELCNTFNGKCHCEPGWRGDRCELSCEPGYWGRLCQEKCYCGPNGSCHHVSGKCSCPPGWHGLNCEKICPRGLFSHDCKMKCPDCEHEPGTCHHETGWCNCPPGATGKQCDLECPIGKYGKNCIEFCLCNNNSTCDSITGQCSCAPGWLGEECSMPCPEGTFGTNCSFKCNCLDKDICNNTNGDCYNDSGIEEELILRDILEESSFPSFFMQILLGFFIFIFLALVLSFVWCNFVKKSYFVNIYQILRARFQTRQWFKNSDVEKEEDTSVTNVGQDDSHSTTQIVEQFMNPVFDNSTKGTENPGSRRTTVLSTSWSTDTNLSEHLKDEFDNVPFMIPECSTSTSISSPVVNVFLGNGKTESVPRAVSEYNDPGKKCYLLHPNRNTVFSNTDDKTEHRYENIDLSGQVKVPKE